MADRPITFSQSAIENKILFAYQSMLLNIYRKKEVQVYKERGKHESLKEKISRLEQESTKLRAERDRAEEKLLEISNESVQVSLRYYCALCTQYTSRFHLSQLIFP